MSPFMDDGIYEDENESDYSPVDCVFVRQCSASDSNIHWHRATEGTDAVALNHSLRGQEVDSASASQLFKSLADRFSVPCAKNLDKITTLDPEKINSTKKSVNLSVNRTQQIVMPNDRLRDLYRMMLLTTEKFRQNVDDKLVDKNNFPFFLDIDWDVDSAVLLNKPANDMYSFMESKVEIILIHLKDIIAKNYLAEVRKNKKKTQPLYMDEEEEVEAATIGTSKKAGSKRSAVPTFADHDSPEEMIDSVLNFHGTTNSENPPKVRIYRRSLFKYHIYFPYFRVTGTVAKELRKLLVQWLTTNEKWCTKWSKIIDGGVYNGGLRIPYSYYDKAETRDVINYQHMFSMPGDAPPLDVMRNFYYRVESVNNRFQIAEEAYIADKSNGEPWAPHMIERALDEMMLVSFRCRPKHGVVRHPSRHTESSAAPMARSDFELATKSKVPGYTAEHLKGTVTAALIELNNSYTGKVSFASVKPDILKAEYISFQDCGEAQVDGGATKKQRIADEPEEDMEVETVEEPRVIDDGDLRHRSISKPFDYWRVQLTAQPCPWKGRLHKRTKNSSSNPTVYCEVHRDRVILKCWDCSTFEGDSETILLNTRSSDEVGGVDDATIFHHVVQCFMEPSLATMATMATNILCRSYASTTKGDCEISSSAQYTIYRFSPNSHKWIPAKTDFSKDLQHPEGRVLKALKRVFDELCTSAPITYTDELTKTYDEIRKEMGKALKNSIMRQVEEGLATYWQTSYSANKHQASSTLSFGAQLNARNDIIVCPNGVLQFYFDKPYKFRPGRMEDFATNSTRYKYIPWESLPDKIREEVEECFETLLPNLDERIYFLQILSRALHGGRRLQMCNFIKGFGADGKSWFFNQILTMVFGDYVVSPNGSIFQSRSDNPQASSEHVMQLENKRYIIIMELSKDAPMNETRFKNYVGSDFLNARHHHGKNRTFELQGSFFVATNSYPTFSGGATDDAMMRRFNPMRFIHRFCASMTLLNARRGKRLGYNVASVAKPDKELEDHAERIRIGLLGYQVHLYEKYRTLGSFPVPDLLANLKESYINKHNYVKKYVTACLQVNNIEDDEAGDEDRGVTLEKLYSEYTHWKKLVPDRVAEVMGMGKFLQEMQDLLPSHLINQHQIDELVLWTDDAESCKDVRFDVELRLCHHRGKMITSAEYKNILAQQGGLAPTV